MKTKIYTFCNNENCDSWSGLHKALAITEHGECIAQHISTSHRYLHHDVGMRMQVIYDRKFPDGYELIPVENPKEHPGLKLVLENVALQAKKNSSTIKEGSDEGE